MFFCLFGIIRTITCLPYPAKYLKLICFQIIRGVVEIFIGIVVTNFKFICMKDKFFIKRNMYSAYLCMEFLCITTCGNFAERELFLVCCSFLPIWPSTRAKQYLHVSYEWWEEFDTIIHKTWVELLSVAFNTNWIHFLLNIVCM